MKNKQGTQNNTNFLDFWKKKKQTKWQYNQNLLNENSSFLVILDWYVTQQWCNFGYIDHLLIKFVIANKWIIHNK